MNSNTSSQIAILCLVPILALSGCSSGKGEGSPPPETDAMTESVRRIDEIRSQVGAGSEARGGLDELEQIRVPAAEAWLDRPVKAHYRELRADHAIRALAQDRPVRFELDIEVAQEIPIARRDRSARTIREHLDSVAAQADWSWRIDRGVVMVEDIETRRFPLSSPPGTYEAGLGLRNLNETGGSTADNRMNLKLDPYAEEIVAQVKNVLGIGEGSAGGAVPLSGDSAEEDEAGPSRLPFHDGAVDPRTAVTVSPSANLLTVTARPNAMRKVEAQMAAFDRAASRVVRISLSLIEVDFRDGSKRDLALNLIRRSSELPLNLLLGSSTAAVLPGADSNSAFVLGGSIVDEGGAAIGVGYAAPGKRATGSTAVVQWLDTLGDAALAWDDTVEVINNRIASVDLTRTEQFVSSITREPVEGSDQLSTEIEFDDLRTGLVVHVQPTARADGRITLTLGFSRSALVGRTPYNYGDVQGQTHTTDDFNRSISISLKDGEPRLLSSLSESESRREKSRIPFFGRFGLGTGNNRSSRERDMVMMVTATVIGS